LATRFEDFSVTYRTKDGSNVNVGGLLKFQEVGTQTLKSIFDGSDGLTQIANPVTLSDSGLLPSDVFLDGAYRLTITEAPNSVTGLSITVIDYPTIGSVTTGEFELWDAATTYNIPNKVRAADGRSYQSRTNSNINNNPTGFGNPTDWQHIAFTVATNVLSGGGALTAQVVNILTDGSTYTLPLANSVGANEDLIVELPDEFKAFTPTVSRTSTDTITSSSGSDTDVLFNTNTLQSLRFTSDGSSDWSI